jgi:hypothetical protein
MKATKAKHVIEDVVLALEEFGYDLKKTKMPVVMESKDSAALVVKQGDVKFYDCVYRV